MNKITKLEIGVIVLLIMAIGLYLSPSLKIKKEKRQNSLVSTNAAIFTSKSLSHFNQDKKAKASSVAKMTADELNTLSKNPYSRKLPAYVFENPQCGSILVESDDKIQTITITGYDKNKAIIVRTLIKPPSFVTYEREEQDKK